MLKLNNIEFKALVKGLFLTQKHVQEIGGYKDQKTIRHFFSGEAKPHDDLVAALLKLDSRIDEVVSFAVNNAIEQQSEIRVIGYKNKDQFTEWGDGEIPYYEIHLCNVFRLKKACKKMNVDCRVVPFQEGAYLDFIKENSLDDNKSSMAAWASSFKIS